MPDAVNVVPLGPPAVVRFINARGQYEVDPTTRQFLPSSKLAQLVYLALSTRRRSSTARPSLGIRRRSKIGTNYEQLVERDVREALRNITEAGLATLTSVRITRSPIPGRVFALVEMVPQGVNDPVNIGPVPLSL